VKLQHIYPRQPPSSDSGSKANGDAFVVVTFWLLRLVAEVYGMFPLSPTF
ncbi:hypothetical protein K443DRAFT_117348, partial [Laccaria amethystina LaAM-08-1]